MSPFDKQLMAGRIYARTSKRKEKLQFALEGITAMFSAASRVYVSLSFGKQSLCMAHMVFQAAPQIPMYFLASDETWHMYDYQRVIEEFTSRWPIDLHIIQTHRFFDAESWKAGRDAGDKDLQQMCPRDEWDGWFWGLAKDESKGRKYTCSINNSGIHPTIFKYKDGKLRCTPVQNWTIDDLAAYIGEHNIPMLNIYLKYGLQQRTTARITKKARNFGSYTLLRSVNSKGRRILVDTHSEIEQ
jgi:3'-phosphoadenosine 5'-phosphosulfate sulfotransferase (PAPS reductase)/FAD synthetase